MEKKIILGAVKQFIFMMLIIIVIPNFTGIHSSNLLEIILLSIAIALISISFSKDKNNEG